MKPLQQAQERARTSEITVKVPKDLLPHKASVEKFFEEVVEATQKDMDKRISQAIKENNEAIVREIEEDEQYSLGDDSANRGYYQATQDIIHLINNR